MTKQITDYVNEILDEPELKKMRDAIANGILLAYQDAIKNGNANMEVSQARGSYPSLGQRLNETDDKQRQNTAQLAHKVGGGKKAELEDLSSTVLNAIKGGEGTTFNLLSIPQDKSVTPEKTTFLTVNKSVNVFDKKSKDLTYGQYYYTYSGSLAPDDNTALAKIPCKTGDTLRITRQSKFSDTVMGSIFDANGDRIGNLDMTSDGTKTYRSKTIDKINASYALINIDIRYVDTVMITINNPYPSNYVAYESGIILDGGIVAGEKLQQQISDISEAVYNDNKYVFDPNLTYLVMPDNLYLIEEEPLKLYKSSLINDYENYKNVDVFLTSQKSWNSPIYMADFINESIELDGTKMGSTAFFGLASNQKIGSVYGKNVNINVAKASSKTNKSPKIVMFGDSTIQQGTASKVKYILNKLGFTPTFLGTSMDSYNTPSEARSGWMLAQYFGYATTMPNGSTMTYPSFLKLATSEDKLNHPTWCFTRTGKLSEQNYNEATDKSQDFYIFDFAEYLRVNGYSNPDVCTISMGINDFANYTDKNYDQISNNVKLGLEIICKQILSACPNCKIEITPFPVRGIVDYQLFNTRYVAWMLDCLSFVKSLSNPNIDCVFEHLSQNNIIDFSPVEVKQLSNGNTEYTISDNVHTSQLGYLERARSLSYWIINKIS